MLPLFATIVAAYLLGSLPFGYLVARAKGVNIFEVGSKNPGATNVRRVLGSGPGNLVLALDAAKGAAAVALGYLHFSFDGTAPQTVWFDYSIAHPDVGRPLAGLVFSMLGHSFSCFTGFKGGKGVATGAGGFAVLFPLGMVIALAIFASTVILTRYVSLGSMLAAASLPFAAFSFKAPSPVISVAAMIACFVIYRHRANIARLRAGTENKVGRKKAAATSSS